MTGPVFVAVLLIFVRYFLHHQSWLPGPWLPSNLLLVGESQARNKNKSSRGGNERYVSRGVDSFFTISIEG